MMVVKLNLKVGAKFKKTAKSEKGTKKYALLAAAAAFLVVSAVVIMYGGWELYSLSGRKETLALKREETAKNIKTMEDELARLDREAAGIESRLIFMLAQIPAVEVMTSLDPSIPEGVYLESMSITKGFAVFKGIALEEENVMDFVNKLSAAPFNLSVEVPVITQKTINRRNVRSFSIRCALETMQNIINLGVIPETKNPVVSGDERL